MSLQGFRRNAWIAKSPVNFLLGPKQSNPWFKNYCNSEKTNDIATVPSSLSSLLLRYIDSPMYCLGAQWLSGRVLDSRPRAAGSRLTGDTALCPLARQINASIVLV